MIKKIFLFITTLCLFIVYVSDTYAHKVQMFAYAEGENVFVEGYFADGKKAMKSEVVVYDPSGTELLRGKTNDSGQFNFKAPKKTDLRIIVDAGMGHKTEYTLPASELHIAGGNKAASAVTASVSKDIKSKTVKEVKEEKSNVSQTSRIDDAQLQAIVEKAVEKSVGEAIKPLVRSFTEMQQKNSLTTIIGGIGYILGLMGIVLYFKSRRSS
jgi:nickel transport protein